MIDRLLERLDSPAVLVLGKGGVGKTTTAGAIALALADRGERVHLISTDPAHSVEDLFEQPLPAGAVEPARCAERLALEEFDSHAAFFAWRERAAAPLRELLERGTYLDDEDIGDFLDRSLPGLDEVMGALRLARLEAPDRVVVDTAPTGHTLRLLDAGSALTSWVAALRAMERKALAVATQLGRRPVRLPSSEFLDGLESDVEAFQAFLQQAVAVLVWRAEPLVERESARLREETSRRGVRIAAELRVNASSGRARHGDLVGPRGCAGLREWHGGRGWELRPLPRTRPPRPRLGSNGVSCSPAAEILAQRRRLLFVGKGGVGKTTCAAACAAAFSSSRRVTLVSTDPAGSLGDLLGCRPTREGLRLGERLVVKQLEADAAFQELRQRYREDAASVVRGLGLDDRLSLDRDVMDAMLDLVPAGLDELFGMGMLLEEGDEDLVVLDAAPTGHFLRLLEAPEVARGWLHSIMRLLLKYRQVTGLGSPAERLLELGRRLRALRLTLTDPVRTGAVPVTLDEPLVQAETRRLCEALSRAGVPVAAVIRNRVEKGRQRETGAGSQVDPDGLAECGPGVPVLAAALHPEPIVGLEGVARFFSSWKRVA